MVARKAGDLVNRTGSSFEASLPHLVDQHVGLRIRMRRKMFGWSQERLAEYVGLTFQQVQKYEKGANRVSASKLWAIAQALETDVAAFFDGLESATEARDGSQPEIEVNKFLASADGLDLVEAFSRLHSPALRRLVITLARALSEPANCEAHVQGG